MNARNALLYVTAPVNALVEGLYRQDTTIADILARGDFGLGTFNDLDGDPRCQDRCRLPQGAFV